MNSLRNLFDSAFELAIANPAATSERHHSAALGIREDADHLYVEFEMTGLKKEDFDISLHDDNLTISGERKSESQKREGESFRSERHFGRFSRTVTLPSAVRTDGVSATYTDGVLTVTLPKAEEAKPHRIEVNVK
jgi:HSP20 family protein